MGCDIHIYTERKYDGKWVCADNFKISPYDGVFEVNPIYSGRNYMLFATLANVRNYSNIIPISEPRGLPDDISDRVHKEAEDWSFDGHSHSWFTAKELFVYKNKNPVEKVSGYISPDDQYKLDMFGIAPKSWCKDVGEADFGWKLREWVIYNSVLDNLIEAIKNAMYHEFYIYDFLKSEEKEKRLWANADDFRIVFWFDN